MKKRSFPLTLILVVAAFSLSLIDAAARPVNPPHSVSGVQSKDFKQVVDFEPSGELTLNSDKGSVRVTAWDSNQIEIVARIDAPENVSADYGQRAVDGTRIDVTGTSRSLTVRSNFEGVPYKGGLDYHSKSLPDIHYEIRAPRSLNLMVELDRSKLNVEGFKGKVKFDTDRTTVSARDIEGALRLKIDRGDARLTNVRGSLSIDSDRTEGHLQGITIEGDSRLDIDRGNYELRMPSSQPLTVNADVSHRENFESEFALAMQSSGRTNFEGQINGGGPKFSIHADRGKVTLKRD